MNVVLQLALGTVIESTMDYNISKMALYWFIVAVGSNIWAVTFTSGYAVGSDPVIYGFLATLIVIVLFKWNHLSGNLQNKITILFTVIVFVVLTSIAIKRRSSITTMYTESV